jgi:hypothetical protein
MTKEINRSKTEKVFEMILPALACIALCTVLILSFMAVKNLSVCYRELVNADLTKDFSGSVSYDDHMYAVLGKGIVLDHTAAIADRPALMASFLKEALFYIDERIFAVGILYAMMVSVIALYPLTKRNMRYVWLISPLVYVVYLAFVILAHAILSVPFYFLNGSGIVKILSQLPAVSGGTCAVSLLIRHVKYQKLAAVLVIPAAFILFIVGMYHEFGMYSPKTIDSFDYVYSIEPQALEEGYYDSEKNVVIFGDKEYPPEQAANPEHYTGIKFIGASLFEILNPYSGSFLYMVEQAAEHEVSLPVYGLYAVKGLIWIIFSAKMRKKHHREHI